MTLVSTDCPSCGSTHHQAEWQVKDRFDVVPGAVYSIVRCAECNLLFLNPRPAETDLGQFYAASGYDPFVSSRKSASLGDLVYKFVRRFTVRRKAQRISRGAKAGGRVLDVGCATGEMLVQFRSLGFETCGVEPDLDAARFAREKLGLTVWNGGIEAVPSDTGRFDLIVFWHVLEHVSDLKSTLARVQELLATDGRAVFAVPNPRSYDAGIYGEKWVAWDTPRHLYHFEPDTMLTVLSSSGLKPQRGGAVAFDAFYHCLLSEPKTMAGLVRATVRGGISFLRGVAGAGGSSELYIAMRR